MENARARRAPAPFRVSKPRPRMRPPGVAGRPGRPAMRASKSAGL